MARVAKRNSWKWLLQGMEKERRTWEELSIFESHDYVGKWYDARHGRSLNAVRTREIASCFTQGREYFASAKSAATSVRPLLLYYGVLSLSRGVILLRDRTKTEANLKPNHGLEVVDWQGTLSGGIDKVLELKVRATAGTFAELASASGNLQFTGWWSGPSLSSGLYHAELNPPKFIGDGTTLTLDHLVSRDHRFLTLYERTTGRLTCVHLSEIVADATGVEVSIFHFSNSANKATVETCFGWPAGTIVDERTSARRMPIANYFVHLPGADLNALKSSLPATQYTGGEGMFVLQDFPNGDRLSELLRTFLLSYFLGMLVRYFPSRWIALLRNEKGDVAQPILMAAVNAVETDYPGLVLGTLG